jgi:RNA polymerase sigma factor (sigma-70 family)
MDLDTSELNHLYRYCLALCGNKDDAYDLIQDAIEKYLQQVSSKQIDQPQGYIKRIARNRFYDEQRRQKIVQLDVLEDSDDLSELEEVLEHSVVDELFLQKIWQTLGPKEREVIFLWAVEGLTTAEIALKIDVPQATVLSRLHRLRVRISNNELFASNGGDYV